MASTLVLLQTEKVNGSFSRCSIVLREKIVKFAFDYPGGYQCM
jgi:hypothetical protein